MRLLTLAAMATLALQSSVARSDALDQPEALFKSCPKGVLFKADESGVVVTVIRQGSGKACFSDDCGQLPAATAAEIVTKDGEHGFIAGPMLSYMFAVEPKIVKDFKWRPAETASQRSTPSARMTAATWTSPFKILDVPASAAP